MSANRTTFPCASYPMLDAATPAATEFAPGIAPVTDVDVSRSAQS